MGKIYDLKFTGGSFFYNNALKTREPLYMKRVTRDFMGVCE